MKNRLIITNWLRFVLSDVTAVSFNCFNLLPKDRDIYSDCSFNVSLVCMYSPFLECVSNLMTGATDDTITPPPPHPHLLLYETVKMASAQHIFRPLLEQVVFVCSLSPSGRGHFIWVTASMCTAHCLYTQSRYLCDQQSRHGCKEQFCDALAHVVWGKVPSHDWSRRQDQ